MHRSESEVEGFVKGPRAEFLGVGVYYAVRFSGSESRLSGIEARLTGLDARVALLTWAVGMNVALTLAVLARLFIR